MIASLITGIVLGKIISSSYSEFKNDTTSVEDLLNGGGGVVSPKACNAVNIVAFANNIGIAPGIVVGRLQNEGCIQHNMLNDLKEQYVIAV